MQTYPNTPHSDRVKNVFKKYVKKSRRVPRLYAIAAGTLPKRRIIDFVVHFSVHVQYTLYTQSVYMSPNNAPIGVICRRLESTQKNNWLYIDRWHNTSLQTLCRPICVVQRNSRCPVLESPILNFIADQNRGGLTRCVFCPSPPFLASK